MVSIDKVLVDLWIVHLFYFLRLCSLIFLNVGLFNFSNDNKYYPVLHHAISRGCTIQRVGQCCTIKYMLTCMYPMFNPA